VTTDWSIEPHKDANEEAEDKHSCQNDDLDDLFLLAYIEPLSERLEFTMIETGSYQGIRQVQFWRGNTTYLIII